MFKCCWFSYSFTLGKIWQLLSFLQIIIWFVIPAVSSSSANHTNNTLSLIVFIQYIPRLFLIFPLNARIVKATGVVTKTAWAGAAYNLLLYMLASHVWFFFHLSLLSYHSIFSWVRKLTIFSPLQVLGALWYLLSIERQYTCWITECLAENVSTTTMPICNPSFLDCSSLELPERKAWRNSTLLLSNCDATNDGIKFNFGMFADALTSEIVAATFIEKYLYCLWWGLKNLRWIWWSYILIA